MWHKAKAANDWTSFEPYVDRIVETLKRHAGYMDPKRDPYDVWLDQYERGMDAAVYDRFFEAVRQTVVPLVHAIGKRGTQPKAPFLTAHVPDAVQRAMSFDLMKLVGLDSRTPASPLPNTPSPRASPWATRASPPISTRTTCSPTCTPCSTRRAMRPTSWVSIPPMRAPVLRAAPRMGIHESQSRFFENTAGRSRAFMTPLLALLRKHVPEVYGSVSEDEVYRAVNIAQPSLIRTEADELTYPLHVMVRYEIERMLFAGEATAKDIPALWAQKTREYLGLDVPNDTLGCLQDTHWSGGSFGYFPTYALGSAYDAQHIPAMERAGVDLDAACAAGDLAPVRAWLGEHIWQWGRAKDAGELVEAACGAPFDATFYCDYLAKKFGELYQL